ncbi:MAG: hypothetical protein ACUVX8_09035 [Candidatus Zipacnadales bacterium]
MCPTLVFILAPSLFVRTAGAATVQAKDSGPETNTATWECTSGHTIEKRHITLDNGLQRYTFQFQGCQDASHEGKHPCSEGNFGMPDPTPANWYWGGFLKIVINGTDAILYDRLDLRITEQGARGGFQAIWAHPDAEVGLRILLPADANHVLAQLVWKPRPDHQVQTVVLNMTCYPSFFTAARQRTGERHCRTPRLDKAEPGTFELVPAEDFYLYYYDAVFDVARGEGDGPCAAMIAPEAVEGGRVSITGYPIHTELRLRPDAGEARLAFYDFTGSTNNQAGDYLRVYGAQDLAVLEETDFRPTPVCELILEEFQTEATQLLTDAAEDGIALKPQIDDLLAQVRALKEDADKDDWRAQAELATILTNSEDLFWKLRAFAVLNKP